MRNSRHGDENLQALERAEAVDPAERDPDYWSLEVRAPSTVASSIELRLIELGFPAQERRDDEADTALVVYDTDAERLRAAARALQTGASSPPGTGIECTVAPLGNDWRLAWTEHLAPVQLTARVTLVPHAPNEPRRASELYLEPAFAFGFGEHPTTRLLAGWLEAVCLRRPGISVLDVGAGTGVLSLLARMSGAGRVVGVDTSADAISAAHRNAALNGAEGLELVRGSVEQVQGSFGCVVANIEANVLQSIAGDVAARVGAGGELGLSGLLLEQQEDVARCYAALGLELEVVAREGEWCALASSRPR